MRAPPSTKPPQPKTKLPAAPKKLAKTKAKFPITFITGNKKKLEEFLSIMSTDIMQSFEITNKAVDLEEIQGSP